MPGNLCKFLEQAASSLIIAEEKVQQISITCINMIRYIFQTIALSWMVGTISRQVVF